MTFLPVVERELRVASRRRNTYRGRSGAAILSILVTAVALFFFELQYSVGQGRLLFSTLALVSLAYCLLAGMLATSDCISSEKREGTIGLLFLTDLKGYDIVLGKLVSSGISVFYAFLASVPVLALTVPMGGVTLGELLRMVVLFLNSLFLSMAAGVFASSFSRNDRRALMATASILLAIASLPYVIAAGWALWRVHQGRPPGSFYDFANLLKVSPAFAYQLTRGSYISPALLVDFCTSLLIGHLLAWALLISASVAVPRVCRERPPERLRLAWQRFRDRCRFGSPGARRTVRGRLLGRNAFYWLAARDRLKPYYVWLFVLAFGGIWGWAAYRLESFIFDWDVSLWSLFLIFIFLKVWFVSEVCTHWVEQRESGAFELLLSTPLSLKDIARGQFLALWRQFGWPIILLLGFSGLLLASALRAPHYGLTRGEVQFLFLSVTFMLVLDLYTLKWVGMGQAIATTQIHRAISATCTRVLILPTLLVLMILPSVWLLRVVFWSGSPAFQTWWSKATLWLAIGVAADLFYGLRSRHHFFRQFRTLATERFAAPTASLGFWSRLSPRIRRALTTSPKDLIRAALPRSAWMRGFLATGLAVVICAGATLSLWRYWTARQLKNKLISIRAAGEPINRADLKNLLPIIAESENASRLLESAVPLLSLPNRWPGSIRHTHFTSGAGLRRLKWAGADGLADPELRVAASNIVVESLPGLELLHQASRLEKSGSRLDWSESMPYRDPLTFIGGLRPAVAVLQLEGCLALLNEDPARAVDSAVALLGLARAFEQEPFLPAQQERLLQLQGALGLLDQLLNRHLLDEERLRTLGHQIQRADQATGPALSQALIVTRCWEVEAWLGLGNYDFSTWNAPPPPGERLALRAGTLVAIALGLRDRSLLNYLEQLEPVIARARQLGSGQNNAASASDSGQPAALPAIEHILAQHLETLTELRLASLAIVIERFRHSRQRVPDTLEELKPEFVASLPLDPFDNRPFRYQRLTPEPGYLIFSARSRVAKAANPMPSPPDQPRDELTFTVRR